VNEDLEGDFEKYVLRSDYNRLVHRLETGHGRILAAFAFTVALRDEGTGGHCERVAHNATALGKALAHIHEKAQKGGESEATKHAINANFKVVWWAGTLHDIGKLAIPEDILNKPGKLNPEEYRIVKTHADIGADLVAGVSSEFDAISEGIRSHHEHWNGKGYPKGLAGEKIPLAGRCVAIADVFEAMTTDRPYHSRIPEAEGIEHIQELAGNHLWGAGVDAFVNLWENGDIYTSRHRFIPPFGGASLTEGYDRST
jgi:putative two-component system response regulator